MQHIAMQCISCINDCWPGTLTVRHCLSGSMGASEAFRSIGCNKFQRTTLCRRSGCVSTFCRKPAPHVAGTTLWTFATPCPSTYHWGHHLGAGSACACAQPEAAAGSNRAFKGQSASRYNACDESRAGRHTKQDAWQQPAYWHHNRHLSAAQFVSGEYPTKVPVVSESGWHISLHCIMHHAQVRDWMGSQRG